MQQIGRYEVVKEAGRGGMSTVYEAFDPLFKRAVALKVMTRELIADPKLKARFTREAQTIAALEHPAIVPVYDFGEDDQRPFLVMRLMTGGTLSQRLKDGPMSINESAKILRRIGSALERAHAQGVIHRDLKPSNIMFDQYGDAFLADFGIARLTEGAVNLTGENVIGTPAYMSPEQIHGDEHIDGRSDIYALGVITFEMLTGRRPFEATTAASMMMHHLIDPVPDIREIRPDLPPGVEEVITRSMAKSPDDRYHEAGELTDTLDSLAQIAPQTPATASAAVGAGVVAAATEGSLPGETPPVGIEAVRDEELTLPDSGEQEAPSFVAESAAAVPAATPQPAQVSVKEAGQGANGRRRWLLGGAALVLILLIILGVVFWDDIFPPGGGETAGSGGETATEAGQGSEEIAAVTDVADLPPTPAGLSDAERQAQADQQMDRFYVAMDEEDYGTAEEAILEAIALVPDQAGYFSELAWLRDKTGDPDGAVAALTQALELEPDNGDYYAGLAGVYREQGDLDQALKYDLQAVELSPDNAYTHMDLAGIFAEMGDYDQALEQYNQAIEINHDEPAFYNERAGLFIVMEDYDAAINDLERASELDPENRDYFTHAADIFLYDLEDPQRALDFFNMAVERSPDDAWVYADRALADSALGDPHGALDDMNRAIELDPENAEFYIRRSQLYQYDLEDLDAALGDLNRAVDLAPDNPDAFAERAHFYQYLVGDMDLALADRTHALELAPDEPWRYVDRALLLKEMDRQDEALADLNHCAEIDSEYYWCYYERGWLLVDMNRQPEAVENFRQFLELAPEDDCPECHVEADNYIQEHG